MKHNDKQFFFPTTESIEAAKSIETPKVEVIVQTLTKADKARIIFNESYAMQPVPQRKDILARFVNEAGCTPKGAATYLQNFKDKAGITVKRTPVVA